MRPGYKQTEVGLIPEDWEVISIQAMLDNKYLEDHLDGNHGALYPKSHEFVEFGVPYIGANDFNNGQVNFLNCKHLSEERAKKFKKGVAHDGDVLFAHNATVGPVALLRYDGDYVILSTTATYFRCNHQKLNNIYFRFVLEARYFIEQYRAVMAQSTRYQVPITTQKKFLVSIPPLPEQQIIAETLLDVDGLLAALDRLIAKKRAVKTGAMQQLLTGEVRVGEGKGNGRWVKRKQVEVCNYVNGRAYSRTEWETSGVPVVRLQNLTGSGEEYYYSNLQLPERQYMDDGDLIFMWSASFGPYIWHGGRAIYHYHIWKIDCDEFQVDKMFYYYKLLELTDQLKQGSSGSTMAHITKGFMEKYEITIPESIIEQRAIAAILADMDAEIAALEARRAKTHALKQGMMQELLTGRTRLV